MLRFAIIRSQPDNSRLSFALYVRNSDSHPARLMKLLVTAGAVDIDEGWHCDRGHRDQTCQHSAPPATKWAC